MKVGTKSVLFGVHQFIVHPLVVARGWRKCWGHWPNCRQWVAIICHDLGYWGCADMDGPEGVKHPVAGARLAGKLTYAIYLSAWLVKPWLWNRVGWAFWKAYSQSEAFQAYWVALYHSTRYAQQDGAQVSALYLPDKISVLFESSWFYRLRGWLSGETKEYVEASPLKGEPTKVWFDWYCARVRGKLNVHLAGGEADTTNYQSK